MIGQIRRPDATETEVFVDGVGMTGGETVENFQARAPVPMTTIEWVTYAPIFKARYLLPMVAVALVLWAGAPNETTNRSHWLLAWIYLTPALTAAVLANLRLARWLVRHHPTWSPSVVFYITVFSLIATAALEGVIGSWLIP